MKARLLVAVAAAAFALTGCNAQQQHDMALADAQQSLQQQFPEKAQLQIDQADRIADRHSVRRGVESKILRAEANIQMGRLDEAQRIAEEITASEVPGTVARAQAEEVLAKIAIRQGRFLDAQLHLNEADRSYVAMEDKARVTDLGHLVRGLEAYSQGQTQIARTHWKSIADEQMRASVAPEAPQE